MSRGVSLLAFMEIRAEAAEIAEGKEIFERHGKLRNFTRNLRCRRFPSKCVAALKATKDTHGRAENVSFVALSKIACGAIAAGVWFRRPGVAWRMSRS